MMLDNVVGGGKGALMFEIRLRQSKICKSITSRTDEVSPKYCLASTTSSESACPPSLAQNRSAIFASNDP